MVDVEVKPYSRTIEALVEAGWLSADDAADRAAVARAISGVIGRWAQAWR